MAGVSWTTRRFPVRIGRAPGAAFRLEEDGVWEDHLVLDLDREGFLLKVQANALARVNGESVSHARLRNGDTIDLGVVSLRFWLSGVGQSRLRFTEALSWLVILAVSLAQISILYWLLR